MVNHAELCLTRPDEADLKVWVLVLSIKNVGRFRRDADAIRLQHRPFLAAQNFPFAMTHVDPVNALTERVTVRCLVGVRRLESEEIGFHVAGDAGGVLQVRVHSQTQARVLRGEATLGQRGLRRAFEGNGAKTGGDSATEVLGARKRSEIEKSAGRELSVADLEGKR